MKKILLLLLIFALPSFANDNIGEGGALPADKGVVKPLELKLSEAEKQLENSTDLEFIENETKLKDLSCDDKELIKQVREFILQNTISRDLRSVPDKRARLLLVKNLRKFEEVKDSDVKDNFEVSAALAYLRINEGRNIAHICLSKDNVSKKFANVYILIYQDLNHYKITVANLMKTPSSLDKATFMYSDEK